MTEKTDSKTSWLILAAVGLVFLILGLAVGYGFMPTKTIEVQAPFDISKCPAAPACVETICEECAVAPQDSASAYLDKAKLEVMNQLEDNDLLVCDGTEYDLDQVAITKVDTYSVYLNEDKEVTVDMTGKLKYLDRDTQVKCYTDLDASVTYPKDKDTDPEVEFN